MMTRRLVFGLSAVLFLAPAAWGWPEPNGFQGLLWGASTDDARAMFRATGLRPAEAFCYGAACLRDGALGAAPARFAFHFADGRFGRVVITFRAADYEQVRAYFTERYGPPTVRERFPAAGPVSINERLVWQGNRVVVQLQAAVGAGIEGRASVALAGAR